MSTSGLSSGRSESFNLITEDMAEAGGERMSAFTMTLFLWENSCGCAHFHCVFPLQLTQPNSEVPDHIRPSRLIKALTQEIRFLEVRQA